MPLSLEEATKRCESYSHNIQDSIFIMESFLGSHHSFSFDLPQVITNLGSIDTYSEERNAAARIKVLEEYQRMFITERKRRSMKQVVKGKMESADFKMNLKRRRQSQRVQMLYTSNVQETPTPKPDAGHMPPQVPAEQMPPQVPAEQMPPQVPAEQMPPQVPAEQMPTPELIAEEFMLEL